MMYDKTHGYVIAILSNGKVLRESKGRVHLPFNSEYAIRIKNNKSGNKAVVEVTIDGTSVLGRDQIVLDSHQTLDLERMILDGDNCQGPKFKFVPLDDDDVQDPTSCKNGIVEIKFFEEINWPQFCSPPCRVYPAPDDYIGNEGPLISRWPNGPTQWRSHTGDSTGILRGSSEPQFMYYQTVSDVIGSGPEMTINNCSFSNVSNEGATVEGSESTQQFRNVQGPTTLSKPSAVLRLKLVGITAEKPVFVKDTRHQFCTGCSKKARRKDKFCSACGLSLCC